MAREFKLFADGGSRGNPGPAAYGAVVIENEKVIAELAEYIGTTTNNYAEYRGLIAGLEYIHELDNDAIVEVSMDSKLVVEQMSGRWQIKHADMRDLAAAARNAHHPSFVTYNWVPREANSHADEILNKALDKRVEGVKEAKPINLLTDRLVSKEVPTMIYLVRHGETEFTSVRRFSGIRNNPKLIDRGREQAEAVGKYLAKLNADYLIASPLARTAETAEIVAKQTGHKVEFDDAWVECDFGDWDGLSVDEVKEKWPDEYTSWISSSAFTPPGGESYDDLAARIEPAFDALADKYPGQKVVVVTHNGVIKQIASLVMEGNPNSLFHIDVSPCSISSFSIWPTDGLRAVRSINERGHLR